MDVELCLGCPACGARAVGPPLAKPEYELRSFGRAFGVATGGVLMLAAFFSAVIAALVEHKPASQSFYSLLQTSTMVAAGEVVAWRVKWFALPVILIVLWSGRRLISGIKRSRDRFGGLSIARGGFAISALVTILVATLIGVTIPARLRQRQDALEATINARGYTLRRAFMTYRDVKGTYPNDLRELSDRNVVPDPDGSIAEALRQTDPNLYQPGAVVASSKVKTVVPRGGALRNAPASSAGDSPGVSFNSYELRLPSEHRLLGSDDDFIMKDGVIMKAADWAAARPRTP